MEWMYLQIDDYVEDSKIGSSLVSSEQNKTDYHDLTRRFKRVESHGKPNKVLDGP